MQSANVLVLDSHGADALALCRTLGKKGLSVTAGGTSPYLPGMLSKYTDSSYVYPDPTSDGAAFVDHLWDHVTTGDCAAVFPVNDVTTAVCSRHRDRLESTGTAVGVEDWETWLVANDKARLFELIRDIDVPMPRTYAPERIEDITEVAAGRSEKVAIKPRRTTVVDGSGGVQTTRSAGVTYVDSDESLTEQYHRILERNPTLRGELPIVQEFVGGSRTMATAGLAEDGELVATFQHERVRTYPLSGGVSVVGQGVQEPRMREYTARVVEALGWTGPFHVEYVKTHDGDFALLEMNGRYWGSLALTINSGVDVPWYHYQQLIGQQDACARPPTYRTDVRQRRLFYKDIRWLADHLAQGDVGALVPFTTSFFTTREEYLDVDDPVPFAGLFPRTLRILRNRATAAGAEGRAR